MKKVKNQAHKLLELPNHLRVQAVHQPPKEGLGLTGLNQLLIIDEKIKLML